jgi:pimeloyl-ACP methyl ester carboxylesterase
MNNSRWIFLRGLTRGNIHWGKFPEILKLAYPDIEVEFLEIPGNGYLNLEKTSTDINQILKQLKNRSKFCQQNLSFNICGISLGGMVALKWAELFPQDVESVTIINSSLKQLSPLYHRLLPNNYAKIFKAIGESDIQNQEKIILQLTSNKSNETQSYLKSFTNFATEHKILRFNIIRQLILANRIRITNFPNIPLIIIVSENDRLVSSHCSKIIFKVLGGSLHCHPSAGHDLPLDEPDWLLEILARHFYKTPNQL